VEVMSEPSLSIILPVYNEEKVIAKVIADLYEQVVQVYDGKAEIIVAEDGSTDNTKQVLADVHKKIPFVLVSGVERKGYNKANKDALALAKSDLVFLSDAGGGHDPQDFFRMLPYLKNYDVVSGIKKQRKDPWQRIVMSKVYNAYISVLFLHRFRDIDAGFKIYKRKVLDAVLPECTLFKECISTEILLRTVTKGFKIKEIPVTHLEREILAQRTFSFKKLPKLVGGIFVDVLKLRFKV
jgi:dolichol-phosphate mannosyltransferase